MATTLHQRIALLNIAAVVLAVGLTVALNYQSTRVLVLDSAQNSFIADLQARSQAAATSLDSASDAQSVRTAQRRIGGDTIVVADGHVAWAESRPDEIPADLRSVGDNSGIGTYYQRIDHDSRPQLVVALVTGRGPLDAANRPAASERVTIYGFRDLSDQQRVLSSMVTTAIVSTLAVVIVVALLGFLASRRLTRPLRELDSAARGLSSGTFATVPVPDRARDEVATLTRSFNDAALRLNELVDDLSDREAASRQFAEDVAHELRTPLTAMLAVVEILEQSSAAESDDSESETADRTAMAATKQVRAQAVRTTVTETRRMATLVNDLLEVSRPESDEVERLFTAVVDVRTAVNQVLTQRGLAEAVEVRTDEQPAFAAIEMRRFELIIANLITNAQEHGAPPIELSVSRADAQVSIRVRDHGPGIPDTDRARVFDRFFKADVSRGRTPGSGLGLSIAARNARLHGGSLTLVASGPGHTEFLLSLPESPVASENTVVSESPVASENTVVSEASAPTEES